MTEKINITFPDGSKREYDKGVSAKEIAESIGPRLAKDALAVSINDELADLSRQINKDSKIDIITFNTHKGQEIFHHSTAHLMAQAVIKLFPKAKPTIGPTIEGGFYYDIDIQPLNPEDLEKIETEMKKIVEQDLEVKRHELSREKALELFKDNKYKVELIKELPKEDKITYYEQGEFKDLCRGPHIPKTGMIKAFKLTKVSSAYWRGDAKNTSLQRIYGVSFPDKKDLNKFIELQKEAEKRDHRKIGRDLDLYSFHVEAPGMPFFHNKGAFIWNSLVTFITELLQARDYELVKTPIILNQDLWKQSGHWDHYKDNMYTTKIDSMDFGVKPMNCPGHLIIYKNKRYSYRELPLRMGEFGLVHRHELSGVLSGLFRVRCFTQDDAHVFCTKNQIKDEIKKLLELTDLVYKTFGFEYQIELSTKPEKAMGDPKLWELAEKILKETLSEMGRKYVLNEGDGAFYGPKIDFHLKDAIGRTWQCGTIQLDFQMPENFDLTFESKDGGRERVVMIHRAILGSVERFLGILIEHFAGKLPLWLTPIQVTILTVSEKFNNYAKNVADKMKASGLRVELDDRTESIGKKVREAQLQKINYILVVGENEEKNNTVAVRTFNNQVHGEKKVDEFIKQLATEVLEKKLPDY